MLRKSRYRAVKAFFGSAMLLALPLTTGCQTANFGGNVPGFGWVSGWWAGSDASKADPTKPPAGWQLPSDKANPNENSYAGGAQRGSRSGYGADEGARNAGGYPKEGYASQNGSYAAGNRANTNNWGGANRQASASTVSDAPGEGGNAPAKGYGATAATSGGRSARAGGYDLYGGETPSTSEDEYAGSARGSAYSADARSGSPTRGGAGYSARMTSGSQRATREEEQPVDDYGAEAPAEPSSSGSRFSNGGGYGSAAPAARGGRTATLSDEGEGGAVTADEDAETSYPQTSGYGSGYRVPSTRGGAAPSIERRYPAAKQSKSVSDDYGMSEEAGAAMEEGSEVAQAAATEDGRYGLSSKAASILEGSGDGEFRPGSTGRPGSRRPSQVSQAGYSDEKESDSTASRARGSRFSE